MQRWRSTHRTRPRISGGPNHCSPWGACRRPRQPGRKALALDPLSAVINNALAYVYQGRRDNDEAIRLWRRAVALEPDVYVWRASLMIAYLVARRSADAEAVAKRFDTSHVSREIRRGLTDSTYAPQARAALATWRRTVPDRSAIPTALLAWWYARLGVRDSALVLVRRAVAERDPVFTMTLESSLCDPLRLDTRWEALIDSLRRP